MKKTDKLISQIRSSSRGIVRQLGLLENCFASIGSTSECHAMVELDTHGAMSAGQLSEALNLEKSTVSRLVAQLLEDGICYIKIDEDDRRNKLISLTKKGLDFVAKIHAAATLQVKRALDLMSEEEKNIVVQGLSIYAKALKKSGVEGEQQDNNTNKKRPKDIV